MPPKVVIVINTCVLKTGLPPVDQRGPICIDCEHVMSVDECHSVTLCHSDESCYIEQLDWGDGQHFKLGCEAVR